MADSLLRNMESTVLGTAIVFHIMIGYKPHQLDQDVRRWRLRFLPNRACGKVALFSRVPSDPTGLRECTANGEGCTIKWKPTTTGVKTWIREDYGAHAFSDNHV